MKNSKLGGFRLYEEDIFLDRLYEAGAIPELWPKVLAEFNRIGEVAVSVLFAVHGATVRWASSENFHEVCTSYLERGYMGNDDRTIRLLKKNHAGFLVDHDVFAPEEWDADPIRRDLFIPAGYGWGVGTNIQAPSGDMLIFHGERRFEDGPPNRDIVARLDRLRPHLARAALLSSRVAFQRSAAAVTALEVVGIPAAVLDDRGQAIVANGLLHQLNPAVVLARPSRIGLANKAADERLIETLAKLRAGPTVSATQSIPVPATGDHSPMIVHIHPVRGQARDIFTQASYIMLLTPVTQGGTPAASVIQGLFDLTPAEAKVTQALAGGMPIGSIAASTGVSPETIRNQLRSVFAKTGVHRQSDLVGLLQGLVPKSSNIPPR